MICRVQALHNLQGMDQQPSKDAWEELQTSRSQLGLQAHAILSNGNAVAAGNAWQDTSAPVTIAASYA